MTDISFPEFVAEFFDTPEGVQLADVSDWFLERIASSIRVPVVLQGKLHVPREPSSEEKGFIRAFWCADYGDALPRLVYADWLDEHGFAAEAVRARADRPPVDCDCGAHGWAVFRRVLICWACQGRGTLLGAGPDRGNPSCHRCGGKGKIRCASICPTCNDRWVPPKITKVEPGDLLWSRERQVRWFDAEVDSYWTRPEFQGDAPVGRALFSEYGSSSVELFV